MWRLFIDRSFNVWVVLGDFRKVYSCWIARSWWLILVSKKSDDTHRKRLDRQYFMAIIGSDTVLLKLHVSKSNILLLMQYLTRFQRKWSNDFSFVEFLSPKNGNCLYSRSHRGKNEHLWWRWLRKIGIHFLLFKDTFSELLLCAHTHFHELPRSLFLNDHYVTPLFIYLD